MNFNECANILEGNLIYFGLQKRYFGLKLVVLRKIYVLFLLK